MRAYMSEPLTPAMRDHERKTLDMAYRDEWFAAEEAKRISRAVNAGAFAFGHGEYCPVVTEPFECLAEALAAFVGAE